MPALGQRRHYPQPAGSRLSKVVMCRAVLGLLAEQPNMVNKFIAQRDVEYFNELLSKETDENRRAILLRLLAEAEKMRQVEEEEERIKGANTDEANIEGD